MTRGGCCASSEPVWWSAPQRQCVSRFWHLNLRPWRWQPLGVSRAPSGHAFGSQPLPIQRSSTLRHCRTRVPECGRFVRLPSHSSRRQIDWRSHRVERTEAMTTGAERGLSLQQPPPCWSPQMGGLYITVEVEGAATRIVDDRTTSPQTGRSLSKIMHAPQDIAGRGIT